MQSTHSHPAGSDHLDAELSRADDLAQLRRRLLSYAKRELRNADVAEDVTQETMLALFLAPEQFRGEARYDVYAIGVLRHKIADACRARKRETPVDAETLDHLRETIDSAIAPHASPLDDADRIDAKRGGIRFWRTLRKCLHTLPERTRSAFVLHEIQEWDMRSVCSHLGVTPTHVSVMTHRARAHLRKHWHEAERALASA